ncbi:MAG: hypothetical protein KF903_12820 [Dokdonella sp.]|uniref:DUF6923 family protein n=1 Tax=Dokdonella sp. TaxID=2291710 RepID=UPI0025BE3DC0|nr:hypothetical protein [Dokdonella sp.]MBX3701866.1 hypothetical protein [Dokdonella sp.]MCW5579184.1 hypothetical protein [Dokdonella sp.]
MRALTCYIAAGLIAVAVLPSARAASLAYGEAFDTLYRIELPAHTASEVGVAGRYGGQTIAGISGLSTMPDGSLFAVASSLKALVRIDAGSGVATPIGLLGIGGGSGQYDALDLGMTATCTGALYLTSGVLHTLYSVDPATGAATRIGDTGVAISGLAERGGELFGAGSKGDHALYRINPRTGAASRIGEFGAEATRWINSVALGFGNDGTLWAVLNYVPPQNDSMPLADWSDLATIDPNSGRLHRVGALTGPESLRKVGMKGFTAGPAPCTGPLGTPNTAPVDAPWALIALALGLIAFAARRQRA